MSQGELLDTNSISEPRPSRRSFLLGLGAGALVAVPLLSTSTQAAVSMFKSGVDPDVLEPEVTQAGKKGGGRGRGRGGGKGRGRGRGRGHGHRGHGRGRGRGRHYYYRGPSRRYGRRRYGGSWGRCYDPWYRRRFWWRCTGIW